MNAVLESNTKGRIYVKRNRENSIREIKINKNR